MNYMPVKLIISLHINCTIKIEQTTNNPNVFYELS